MPGYRQSGKQNHKIVLYMLNIILPANNIPEREYIVKTLFSDFLGLAYNLKFDHTIQHYSISFDDCVLEIRDGFFNRYPGDLSYLKSEALPGKVIAATNDFTFESDVPVIYGNPEISISEKKISCGIDIFASSFFMLSRWEEYVGQVKDDHERFPFSESAAFKNGFLHRPVVNEYVEMLWNMLIRLGYQGKRKERNYELVLTHDIDHMDYPRILRILAADVLKRRNLKRAWEHFQYYVISRSNPFDTFGFILDISEKLGLKSHFYFMAANTGKSPDTTFYLNSKRFRKKIREIKARGHLIGFHPGYYVYNDEIKWSNEKNLLSEAAQCNIVEGRQHYLRFGFPETIRIWENNRMDIDSTLGYANKEGYRCGTGDLYPVFDCLNRKELHLKERPLIIMDGTLKRQYSLDQSLKVMREYMALAKRYNSTLTILFHNSSFYGEEWEGYDDLYKKALLG
jgi:hypothetical protein